MSGYKNSITDINGNVGIGTDSPDIKLEVVEASPTDGIIADFVNSTNAGGTIAAIKLSNAVNEACDIVLGANRVGANFGSDFFISLSDSTDGTNQERFRITEAGNVGIGTTGPGAKLEVLNASPSDVFSGQLKLTGSETTGAINTGGALAFTGGNGVGNSTWAYIRGMKANSTISNNDSYLSFATRKAGAVPTERMRIDSSGNVGIGTTSPASKLEIGGATGSYSSGIGFAPTGTGARIYRTFIGGDGSFRFDDGTAGVTRLMISSAGNVGIGTTSPATKLDVKITTSNRTTLEPVLSVSANGNGPYTGFGPKISFSSNIYYGASTGNPVGIIETAYIGAVMGSDYANDSDLVFATRQNATNVDEKMRITSSGNVGIGTISPSAKLDIVSEGTAIGDTGYFYNARFKDSSNVGVVIGHNNIPNGNGMIAGINKLAFLTYGTEWGERMIIDGAGNVGIGTTNANYKLNLSNSNALTAVYQQFTNGTTGTTANDGTVMGIDSDGDFIIVNQEAKDIKLYTSDTERMRIDSSGRVGIGTSNIYGDLHLGGGEQNVIFTNTAADGVAGATIARLISQARGYGNNGAEMASIDFVTNSSTWYKGDIVFKTNNVDGTNPSINASERMRIDSNGFVGIGLEPYTSTGLLNLKGSGLALKNDLNGQSNNWSVIQNQATTSGSSIDFISGQGLAMTIAHNRNVGIGTTSPSKKLHVYSSDNEGIFMEGTGGGHWFNFKSGTSNLWSMGAQTGLMGWYNRTDSTYKMVITDGGNVGIGTSSPSVPLEINGLTRITRLGQATTYQQIEITDVQTTFNGQDPDGYMHYAFKSNDSTKLFINGSSGSVGIGTTSPGHKLDVNGNARVSGTFYLNKGASDSIQQGSSVYLAGGSGASYTQLQQGVNRFIIFGFNGSAWAETMTINNTNGNVGIGTTATNVGLAVQGQSSTGGRRLSLGILDINSGGTPTQVKIVTNIPYASTSADFTVNIKGFIYGYDSGTAADLSIHWHHYNNTFFRATATSKGSWAPTITLGAESGKVVIHLSSPGYWPKFYVESMYSSYYTDVYASGWSWTDAAISSDAGTPTVTPSYKSNFGNNFIMNSNGNVGIGTTSPSVSLDVVGAIRATGDVTAYHSSDERLKDNKKVIENAVNKINKINGYEFDWVPKEGVHTNEGHDIGIMAQEVEKILPEIVITRDNGYKAVKYEKLVPLLIESIKELSAKIEQLQNKNCNCNCNCKN